MVLTDRNTGGGRAWQFLRCNTAYRTAWRRRHLKPGLPKQAPFQVRLQTAADLAALRWGLLAWADPDEEDGPIPSFWLKAPLLPAAISPNSTQLRIAVDSGLGPADGVQAQHDILLSPAAISSQLREACALTGWEVPRWGRAWRSSAASHWGRAASASLSWNERKGGSGSFELRFDGRQRRSVDDDATPGHSIGFRVRRPA